MVQGAVLGLLVVVLVLPVVAAVRQPAGERRQLLSILVAACVIRLMTTLVLHASGAYHVTARGAMTPDEATVDVAARLLAGGDTRSPSVLGGSLHTSWLLVTWAVYDLVWNSLLAIKLLNAAIGAALVVPAYLLARRLGSVRAARAAAWLVALFPAALVWSATALRESLLVLTLTTLVLLAVSGAPAARRSLGGWVALVAAALVLVAFTRSYMVPLMMAVLLGAAVLRPGRVRGLRVTAGAVGLALATVLLLPSGTQTAQVTVALVTDPAGSVYNPLSDCGQADDCAPVAEPPAAGRPALPGSTVTRAPTPSGVGSDVEQASSLQSVAERGYLRAFAIAVLAGRPVGRSDEFFLLLQPGVVVWWTVLPLACAGTAVLARARRWAELLATAGYAAAVVIFLALTGQFIRHHYMLEPVGLVLAGLGLASVLERPAAGPRGTGLRRVVVVGSAVMAAAATASVVASLVPT